MSYGKTCLKSHSFKHTWVIENFGARFDLFFEGTDLPKALGEGNLVESFVLAIAGKTIEGVHFGRLHFDLELNFPEPNLERDQQSYFSFYLRNKNEFNLQLKYRILPKCEVFPKAFSSIQTLYHNYLPGKAFGWRNCLAKSTIKKYVVDNLVFEITMHILLEEVYPSSSSTNISEQKSQSNLADDFKALRNDERFSDVIINCNGETFYAHKNVLSARSDVFKAMFSLNMTEARDNAVEITDTDSCTLKSFLDFMYFGGTEGLETGALSLLAIANKYNVSDLKGKCEDFLSKKITHANAAKYLIEGSKHEAQKLFQNTLDFITSNIRSIESAGGLDFIAAHVDSELLKSIMLTMGGEKENIR
mmetsp:Transcript_8794/g.11557  ORF Transcript_8794/g.11557 Transcript_8794/m.11557 type:complete len:361 (+) Transcript_8794:734-1816(+)|eukprot:CAMPEP_0117762078 /NCGR_PEP_ID=MMETSP0947-20121206/17691_1 /TAXON_ID=44440 /ORGANISM="Chattonella subsalsa, Strain CCMP2191" /LENGTH=360 /DNA_ID=CAMNT_0005583251 /DNA_START=322 /DNA_END=1404 /DNA_ORIENTATION=+